MVPIVGGGVRRYVNVDNAATTPALRIVVERVCEFLSWYGSVHRGSGYKSRLSTKALEDARIVIQDFVGADPERDIVILTLNTTTAINKLARRLELRKQDVVLTSDIEHSSNELPWRKAARVVHFRATDQGEVDLDGLRSALRAHKSEVKLVALTGASNITGSLSPIHEAASIAHEHGVRVMIDCAQLAPHRKIDMRRHDDPSHLDYITFSAHKMYAPFGLGLLIGCRETFAAGFPDDVGGGTVNMIVADGEEWSGLPAREHAGTPNAVGAIALAVVMRELDRLGMDAVAEHERALTRRLLRGLKGVAGVTIYGDNDEQVRRDRLGVVPFVIRDIHHALTAAILSYEYGIGVRHGHLCQYEFMRRALGVSREQQSSIVRDIRGGDKSSMYGMVRASLGLHNTESDIDQLVEAVRLIATEGPRARYVLNRSLGEYSPEGEPPPEFEFRV